MVLPYVLAAAIHGGPPASSFWTIVTFLIVFFAARQGVGPHLGVVAEREKQITNSIESAKRERAEAERLLAEQKTAGEARREAAESLRRNQAEMERFREELRPRSRKEAEGSSSAPAARSTTRR